MKEYLKLLRFIKPQKWILLMATICMGFSALFDGFQLAMIVPVADIVLSGKKINFPKELPEFLASFVDKINSLDPLLLLKILALLIPVMILLKGIFYFLQKFLMGIAGQMATKQIRQALYEKFQQLSLDFYSKKRAGELISRITNDVKIISAALSDAFTDMIYQSMQVVLFCFMAFYFYTKLALISFILVPLIIVPMIKIGRRIKKFSKMSQEKMADLNTILVETINGVRIVKGFSREEYEIEKFKAINHSYYKYILKRIKRTLVLSPITEFVGAIAAVAIFLIGGKEVIEGRLSFGVFGAFLAFLLSMIKPFKKLSQVHSSNQQALAASVRIYDILDREPSVREKPEAGECKPPEREIIFEDVWFRYEENEDFVLKNINFKADIGDIIAVVGPTGTGKSTLLNLLPRFYDPTKGRVLFDQTDIRDVKIDSLREKIGLVTQEMILFNDSVRANIGYGKLSASQPEIEKAARKALAYDFIMNLPQKFDTVLGDRGFRLSGGQKQRIAIARAILKQPNILILDEATSQLDSESEALVQKALNNLMEGKTVFVIAHRLSTIKNASKILVMKNGEIIAGGVHQDLLNTSEAYKRLYEIQFNL